MTISEANNANANSTNNHEMSHPERLENSLTVKQMNAAELLATGCKVQDVAEMVGVSRHQVWVWQKNPYFIAAISQRRGEVWNNSKQRLRGLLDKSVDVLEQAILSGDLKASIELLKIVGLHGKIASPSKSLSVTDILTIQATEFVDDLLGKLPSDDPMAGLNYRLQMRPTLIREQYQVLKDQLSLPEEEAESENGEDKEETAELAT